MFDHGRFIIGFDDRLVPVFDSGVYIFDGKNREKLEKCQVFISDMAASAGQAITINARNHYFEAAFRTRRTLHVVDTPLVCWDQFFGNSVMDAHQSACWRRPRELLVKVVAPSSPPRSLL